MKTRAIKRIIGIGGIGKGFMFAFSDNTPLGRNESRMAALLPVRDYCKLHIVFHYLGVLLSPEVRVIPVGLVGDDADGRALLKQMRDAGLETDRVFVSPDKPTMLSACFQYPDKCGGNITASNSACEDVTAAFLKPVLEELKLNEEDCVVALPEVPLEAGLYLLKKGREAGALTAACCNPDEMEAFSEGGGPALTDLLALNQEEAARLANMESVNTASDALKAESVIRQMAPGITLWLTLGAEGALLANQAGWSFYPSLKNLRVANTGGAGDASLAGLLAGMAKGLPLRESAGAPPDGLPARSAGELATLCAGMSVECGDSIDESINWNSLAEMRRRQAAH